MKALQLLLILSSAFVLGACSFDKNRNFDNRVNAENYAYLKAKYDQVAGKYKGSVKLPGARTPADIELTLTIVDVPVGPNDLEQVVLAPALTSRIAFSADQDVLLNKVDYRDDTVPPQILMTSAANDVMNPSNMTARFEVYGEELLGTVSRFGRSLGTTRLKLVSRDTSGPAEGDQEAANERVRRALAPITGTYSGMVNPPRDGNAESFAITVELNISTKKDSRYPSEERQIPALVGTVTRRALDGASRGTRVSVSYVPEGDPPKIYMVTDGTIDSSTPEPISITSTLVNGVMEGLFQGADSKSYPMKLVKE